MAGVMDGLNQKYGPLPLWGWGIVTTLGAGLYIVHRRNTSKSTDSTQAAADQTNTDLGSASELANLFEVAGLMPYQGGDTYVNITEPVPGGTNNTGNGEGKVSPPLQGGNPPRGAGGAVAPATPTVPKTTTGSTTASNVKSYTVKSGDTMIGVASKQFGLPANEQGADALYNYGNNAATIRNEAVKHGKTNDFVRWIYPGEKLQYPAKKTA